jgi:hypothetical protein
MPTFDAKAKRDDFTHLANRLREDADRERADGVYVAGQSVVLLQDYAAAAIDELVRRVSAGEKF